MAEGHRALKHIVLRGRGVGFVHAQERAQVDDKALRGGEFTGRAAAPAGDEGVGGGVGGGVVLRCHRGWVVGWFRGGWGGISLGGE